MDKLSQKVFLVSLIKLIIIKLQQIYKEYNKLY